MEQFEIYLVGETLTINPQENETFQVFRGESFNATIFHLIDETTCSVTWATYDLISPEYAQQIGELIEKHFL